jgi:HlyD family secretion protein
MKKKIIIAAAVVVVLAAIIIANITMKDRGGIVVQTQKVERGDISHVVSASGNIQPEHSVDISADVSGKVTKLYIDDGDRVLTGDTLLIIDPAPYEADVSRERAQLAAYLSERKQAMKNLDRALEIHSVELETGGESLISEEELERVGTEYEVAKQRVEGARASTRRAEEYLKKITVTAPMSGTVTSLDVEEGEVAVIGTMNNPGTVLLTISDLSIMEAEIKVDETDIIQVSLDQEALVKIDAYPDTSFQGVVSEIGNSPIISNRGAVGVQEAVDFLVKVGLTNPPAKLKPGLSATAEITTATRENTLNIPIQAVSIRNVPEGTDESEKGTEEETDTEENKVEKKGVFAIKDGVAEFRPVKTGIVGGMDIEIIEGIEEDDEIVIGSFQILRTLEDGNKVKVENLEDKKKEEEE